jgi:hypothetical protein
MKEGHRNGKLVTIDKLVGRPYRWRCKCDCGNEKICREINLYTIKGVKSCGCVAQKRFGKDRFTKEFIKERITTTDAGCWEWKGAKHRQGYGSIRAKGKTVLAHRLAWEIWNGEIQEDMCVCHRCDNTSCVNPEHLFLGTQKDNMKDCKFKDRMHRNVAKTRRCKLSYEQVIEIKKLFEDGVSRKDLMVKYTVSQTCIAKIVTGQSWNVNWEL